MTSARSLLFWDLNLIQTFLAKIQGFLKSCILFWELEWGREYLKGAFQIENEKIGVTSIIYLHLCKAFLISLTTQNA